MTELDIAALDANDPLRSFRERFSLPPGVVYLDGNSLGALPRVTPERLAATAVQQWGEGLIGSWVGAGWIDAPMQIGDAIGRLVGAAPGQVVIADSTSTNIFKALSAALQLRPGRRIMLTESGSFPTDGYMMQGLASLALDVEALLMPPDTVLERLRDDVAVLLLSHVHYRSGAMHDLVAITARAHAAGALVIWDLSHSAGAMPLDLDAAGVDFAVGCGYKFLNGGPGAPSWLYVAARHQQVQPVLSGWFGHARPFDFEDGYAPAAGIARFQCGTPPILGLSALAAGVEIMLDADMVEVRRKARSLGELFIALMEPLCDVHGFSLASPRDPAQRGSHVSWSHPDGYAMMQALKARGVIGDFRSPDVLRFGLTPLYTSHQDIADAVARLWKVCEGREWDRPAYQVRAAVT